MLAFEALPTSARRADRMDDEIDQLVEADVDAFLVPEVLDGTYRTVDNLVFAEALRRRTGRPVACSVLVAPRTKDVLDARVDALRRAGLAWQFIGPSSRREPVNGPSVLEALERFGGGTVVLPGRSDETRRLAAKAAAGASWASSQILFAPTRIESDIPVLWSVAPVTADKDLAFQQRLGVDTRGVTVANAAKRSGDAVADACHVVVSHVMQDNVPAALEMASSFEDRKGPILDGWSAAQRHLA